MSRRMKVEGEIGYYHCMSRVVGGAHLLGEWEREAFRKLLRRVAEFSGVEVLTYAVMSNHFHVLVAVPAEAASALSDAELVRRYSVLYGTEGTAHGPKPAVLAGLLEAGGRDGIRWRRRLEGRMHDVSEFMRTLKLRFATWYNRTHDRFGTLWADRFKSTLVEGSSHALSTVAAYIDLNPVRAGLAEDPAGYRWCGYAEAMGGDPRARNGLRRLAGPDGPAASFAQAVAWYRLILFGRGSLARPGTARLPAERFHQIVKEGGRVSRPEALRCRLRFMTYGGILGGRAFIRRWSRGSERSPEGRARPIPGADWEGLEILRGGTPRRSL